MACCSLAFVRTLAFPIGKPLRRKRPPIVGSLVVLLLALSVATSHANGRAPVTNGVYLSPSDSRTILVRTTFGLLVSVDDGCSFRWICEQNVGYGGIFDPTYAVGADGTIFATTYTGLRVSRDGGCSFSTATAELPANAPNRIADIWVDALSISSTGEIWVATAENGKPNDVYRSSDNGVTFASQGLQSATVWWKSVAVAPSDPTRVYVAGYEVSSDSSDATGSPKAHLFTTNDAGQSWSELPLTGVSFGFTPIVTIAAIDPTDPRRFYLRSVEANRDMTIGDRLYQTTDAGGTFTEVLATTAPINDVVVRDANTVMVAAGSGFRSDDGGHTFAPIAGAPLLSCLGKRADNSMFGCGANWDPDFMAVGRSADATAWQKIFRFVELAGPLQCAAGTPQHDVCDQQLWPSLKEQFGTKGPMNSMCAAPTPDVTTPPRSGGCCDAGSRSSFPGICLMLLTGLFAVRKKKHRSSSSIALVVVMVCGGLVTSARANGRDPYTSTINFQRGNDQHIVAGMTFGLVESKDGGGTWQWMCEKAVGYGGQYDPDYVYSSTGALFATTFDGLKVRRDACSFVATPPGMTFVSKTEQAPDGTIYFAAADQNDGKIYKSTDDGVTFPTSANPGMPGDWWSSLTVAPSNANRIYLTGYRFVKRCVGGTNVGQSCMDDTNCPGGMCEQQKDLLVFTSNDAGTSYAPMSLTNITPVSANSVIEIVGISSTNDQTVYIKVTFENGSDGDSIYKSTNAGTTWTKILSKKSIYGLSFLARNDGTCIAGTRELGAWVSTNCDTSWTPLAGAPHIGCLYQDTAGVIWACTQNYASPQLNITADDYGIMKSSDLTTWTGVLRYQAIQAPVPCAAGTVQEDQCVQRYMDQQSQWCCLVPQLGITSTAIDCNGALACFGNVVDGATDGGITVKPPKDGCCGTSTGSSSALLSLLVAAGLLVPRRKRTSR